MPRIFDNIHADAHLAEALRRTLDSSTHADFCVGYFNLRGWRELDSRVEEQCRVLIGMQDRPDAELYQLLQGDQEELIDNARITRLKKEAALAFRKQLTVGTPTNEDQAGLRRLSAQLKAGKVVVRLFLKHKLHAKLYMLYQPDTNYNTPYVGFLGSSNLTMSGLQSQGELNVEITETDACKKLVDWFQDRWEDRACVDISQKLAAIIDESWARAEQLPPYYIYLKMAYHLSEEARTGLSEFTIPGDLQTKLFDYQTAAVLIAAQHINRRGGVIIGDVVGLGKTLMATALARVLQEDLGTNTLILCPSNLQSMWQTYMHENRLIGDVRSISNVQRELPDLHRIRVVIIDESHNLRNPESKRYQAIREYIEKNECKCILLTATPYNKSYLDMSAQLRLFLTEEQSNDLGIRPERLIAEMGEVAFASQYQCPQRSLAAFENSNYAEDWKDLMRLFMIRRTRSFIQENYAATDAATGSKYLLLPDGTKSWFPVRIPRTLTFSVDEEKRDDPYARLYSDDVVDAINTLNLPRYGLGNYIIPEALQHPSSAEKQVIDRLSRAGKQVMGFCRTNLFKRLESGGPAFLDSLQRHILRNYIFLHALETGQDILIGTQDIAMVDTDMTDTDEAMVDDEREVENLDQKLVHGTDEAEYREQAARIYTQYSTRFHSKFSWLRPSLFTAELTDNLRSDIQALEAVLAHCGTWNPALDSKLAALEELLQKTHPHEKVLIFTQFADTVLYLTEELRHRGIPALAGVTGDSENISEMVARFSPRSNKATDSIAPEKVLRVLITTDVLSEGQNLQDAAIVVNYDLPWAIIRLVQRAGRVDRIGQSAKNTICYSFLPAEGVEAILKLRSRVLDRLRENAAVVGTDERFFEDEADATTMLHDLYSEKAGILDGEADTETDLVSEAFQIWKNATEANPALKQEIEKLPNVVFSTKTHTGTAFAPEGVLVYAKTATGNDTLAWVNREGEIISQSLSAILKAAACALNEEPLPLPETQHALVQQGITTLNERQAQGSIGTLGGSGNIRRRVYERLTQYLDRESGRLFSMQQELEKIQEQILRYPLYDGARDKLSRQLRAGISDEHFADMICQLREDNCLCIITESGETELPRIICSLGLFPPAQ